MVSNIPNILFENLEFDPSIPRYGTVGQFKIPLFLFCWHTQKTTLWSCYCWSAPADFGILAMNAEGQLDTDEDVEEEAEGVPEAAIGNNECNGAEGVEDQDREIDNDKGINGKSTINKELDNSIIKSKKFVPKP